MMKHPTSQVDASEAKNVVLPQEIVLPGVLVTIEPGRVRIMARPRGAPLVRPPLDACGASSYEGTSKVQPKVALRGNLELA